MESLAVVIQNWADGLSPSIQVNRYLASLYKICYVNLKKDIGKQGDARCFNWALATGDHLLLLTAFPKQNYSNIKYQVLEKGLYEAFLVLHSCYSALTEQMLNLLVDLGDLQLLQIVLDLIENEQAFGFLCKRAAETNNRPILDFVVKRARETIFPTNQHIFKLITIEGAAKGGHLELMKEFMFPLDRDYLKHLASLAKDHREIKDYLATFWL